VHNKKKITSVIICGGIFNKTLLDATLGCLIFVDKKYRMS